MFNIVLYEPEIPSNTGNIGRTCVVAGAHLHLIQPLGFSLESEMLRRAGLGYWHSLDVSVYASWSEFLQVNGLKAGSPRLHLLTKKAQKTYAQARYEDGDYLVFGKESAGLPEELLASMPQCCERIPMLADARSLSDAQDWQGRNARLAPNHAGNKTESPLLQQDVCGNFVDPSDYRISALNLSNSCAIVLYEALRQNDYPHMQN